jgi:putative transposase
MLGTPNERRFGWCVRIWADHASHQLCALEYSTDIVILVVLWRLRYKLSLRDLAEMFLKRGVTCTYEAVREWEWRFTPLITKQLRRKRHGQAGPSWYVDETYVRVKGKWCHRYPAIDADGNLVDSRLNEKRRMEGAHRFFRQALIVVGHTPERVTTDGHASYPRVVRETLGDQVQHRTNTYLNNSWSKTFEVSSSGIIPCMASGLSIQQPVSALPSTNYATISLLDPLWENRSTLRTTTSFP